MTIPLITGLGILTCLGDSTETFWESMIQGRSGINKIDRFDMSRYYADSAGTVRSFAAQTDRARLFVRHAALQALNDAKIDNSDLARSRAKIFVGSAHGDLNGWMAFLDGTSTDSRFPISGLADELNKSLPVPLHAEFISTACTSSTIALGIAKQGIESDETDIAIVCGVDVVSEFILAGFCSLRAISKNGCKPFDMNRDGLTLGEGAGCVVLESRSHAEKRGCARAYGSLAGFGASSDAVHLTAPDRVASGAVSSLRKALKEAAVVPEQVDYINAHGTGTRYNDQMECVAIKKVFGDHAAKIHVNSIKSAIGHTSGACGVIEAVLLCLSMRHDFIPGTCNLKAPMPGFSFLFVKEGMPFSANVAVSMNSAFGGNNACIVVKRDPS